MKIRQVGQAGLIAVLALAVGCTGGPTGGAAPGATARRAELPALRPLDDAHAAAFIRTFGESRDRPRYIVALSPT